MVVDKFFLHLIREFHPDLSQPTSRTTSQHHRTYRIHCSRPFPDQPSEQHELAFIVYRV